MNIHPLFVHFPIGLLVVYALLELIWSKKINKLSYWFYLKAFLVIVGSAMSVLTAVTGDLAEEALQKGGVTFSNNIIDVHAGFATFTVIVFALLSSAYLIAWIERSDIAEYITKQNNFVHKVYLWCLTYKRYLLSPSVRILLAFVGLVAITITGGLGAAIVYGPDIDPFVSVIYHLFFST